MNILIPSTVLYLILIVLSYYFSILYSLNIIFYNSEISENLRLFLSLICGSTICYISGLKPGKNIAIKNNLRIYLIFLIIIKIFILMIAGIDNISLIYQSLFFLESFLYALFFFSIIPKV